MISDSKCTERLKIQAFDIESGKPISGKSRFLSTPFSDDESLDPEDAESFIAAELARRGYTVFDAYAGSVRVSLMGIRNGVRIYVRTVQKLDDGNAKRELAAFRYAPDFFPKHIVSLEPISLTADMCGFRFRTLEEFLASKDY
ncbi:MAG: hypothetical protein LKJ94_05565 [Candidatus Methanomethylophilus sp.]|jgi:hypothetical protein|nr:hypothetical protein [Methanomethylophilus sp.]MCI2075149.1 hypothetical protein [Methanomethylophilus sp.]MCI2092491.1 hypothetical protein [Methanomethylophilus sp.]